MSTRYQITIKKVETNVEFTDSTYKEVFSDETWAGMNQAQREKAGGSQYAYVEHKSTKDITTELFEQTVEELDLPAVVAVVNGLEKK